MPPGWQLFRGGSLFLPDQFEIVKLEKVSWGRLFPAIRTSLFLGHRIISSANNFLYDIHFWNDFLEGYVLAALIRYYATIPLRQGEVVVGKKHRKKKQTQNKPLAPAKFAVGMIIRVKQGMMDPDFADMPLGGWTGTILEIDQQSHSKIYLVEWNQDTLDRMHPVYRKRCQRDDLEMKNMWLAEAELEHDSGELVKVEQPTNLVSRPLSMGDQDDRIRAIFGLTSDDPLLFVNDENLRKYHRYLATHLSFPFQAKYQVEHQVETGLFQEKAISVTVMGLLDTDHFDEDQGILCEAMKEGQSVDLVLAELESTVNIHNRQLMEDYAYWFYNLTGGSSGISTSSEWTTLGPAPLQLKKWTLFGAILKCAIGGGIIGISLGSLLAAMEIVQIGSLVGAVIVGLLGYWVGGRYGMIFGAVNRLKHGSLYGRILGTIIGGSFGALIGALLGAIVGIVVGSFIGALMSKWLLGGRKKILGIALGAAAGATLQAFYFDQEMAMAGAIYGGIIGVAAGVAIVLAIYGLLTWLGRRQVHS